MNVRDGGENSSAAEAVQVTTSRAVTHKSPRLRIVFMFSPFGYSDFEVAGNRHAIEASGSGKAGAEGGVVENEAVHGQPSDGKQALFFY